MFGSSTSYTAYRIFACFPGSALDRMLIMASSLDQCNTRMLFADHETISPNSPHDNFGWIDLQLQYFDRLVFG